MLVLGGTPPPEDLLSWRCEEADHLVAVDSGYLAFRRAGLAPDALIGDMDSCGIRDEWKEEEGFPRLIEPGGQDTTDFEKALAWLDQETGATSLVVLGGLGKRSDHFLSNLLAACRHDSSVELTFDDGSEWIRRVTAETPLRLVGRRDATLSLLPLTPCAGVSTKGLKWNLDEQGLSCDEGFSQSNLAVSDSVLVSCRSGNLFVILQK